MRLAWSSVALGLGISSACASNPECVGPGGLCIDSPGRAKDGGSAQGGGASTGVGGEASEGGVTGGGNAGGLAIADAAGEDLGFGLDPVLDPGPEFGGGGFGNGSGGSSGSQQTSAGTDSKGGRSGCGKAPLPLIVSEWFSPTLSEGDGSELKSIPCPARSSSAVGACYGFEWGQLFYVQLSWKPTPPQDCIEPGPFTMRFQARGELGGEVVNFGLHGASPMNVTLGNQWQTFEIPRNSDSIDPRFGVEFYVEPLVKEDSQQSRIYLDDLQWLSQKPPAPGRCKPPRELPRTCEALDDVDGSAGGGSSSTAPKSWGGPATGACDSGNLGAGGAATLGPDILLIDDFEDGDEWSLPLPDGRAHWAIFNDGTATGYQYPEPCPKPTLMPADHEGSDWSLLTYGCGFDRQGAGMRLTLRTASDCEEPFDASIYDGIQFLAKGWASGEMLLRINTVATTPVRHGGSCVEPEGFPIGCFNAFQTSFYLSRTDEWELIQIPFALLEQGYPPHAWWEWSSNTTSIMSVSWAVSPGDYSPAFPVGTSSFDYAIDDVALYRK